MLTNRGNQAGKKIGCDAINRAAAALAKQVASEGGALTLGGISQTPSYLAGKGKEAVQAVFKKQIDVFVEEGLDFVLCEYFEHMEETEWAIEECLKSGLPVAATMCIGPEGDLHGSSAAECAIRMARAGAHVVGVNCHFDMFVALETMKKMKAGLQAAKERGRMPEGSEKHMPWGQGLEMHTKPWVRARASKEYWEKMKPAGGRPFCPAMSEPDNWGVTAGDK